MQRKNRKPAGVSNPKNHEREKTHWGQIAAERPTRPNKSHKRASRKRTQPCFTERTMDNRKTTTAAMSTSWSQTVIPIPSLQRTEWPIPPWPYTKSTKNQKSMIRRPSAHAWQRPLPPPTIHCEEPSREILARDSPRDSMPPIVYHITINCSKSTSYVVNAHSSADFDGE